MRRHGLKSSFVDTIPLLVLLIAGVPAAVPAEQDAGQASKPKHELMAQSDDFEVRVVEKSDCCPATVKLSVRGKGVTRNLFLSGRIETVLDLALVGDGRVLLAGELPRTGGPTLHLANLDTMQPEQTIWTYGYGVSPSGRWLAYQTHYPRMVPPDARRSIFLLYDLTKAPEENRSGPETKWPEPNLGRPIFPGKNVDESTHSIFAAKQAYHLNSPFLWSQNEERLAFVAAAYLDSNRWPTCYIVTIHLSDHGRVEAIRKQKLTEENVDLPFKTAAYAMREEGRPLCFSADTLEWAEEGTYDRVVAEPGEGSSLGHKVWIDVP